MESSTKLTAAAMHLLTLTQYFIPFGNFLFPIILWSARKSNSDFENHHGRQSINFQLSVFLYSIVLCMIAIPILIYSVFNNVPLSVVTRDEFVFDHLNFANMTGIATVAIVAVFILALIKIFEFFLVICASVKAANGEKFYYPMTIPFIRKPVNHDDALTAHPAQSPQP